MTTKKKCPCENTFNSRGGFEGLEQGLKKGKVQKPFPSFNDAEKEAKQVPRWFPK
jgi:hypothetical protein